MRRLIASLAAIAPEILAVVTGCAGALLLFLAGRRLLHRFRGEPDPADEGYSR